jgi:two-component sensor histidine kinase
LREGTGGGDPAALLPAGRRYREVASLARALEDLLRTTASQRRQLEDAVEEKTTLLREIHHRVKNNLQLIVSLLRMDLRRAEDGRDGPAAARFERAIARVHAIGLVHEQLYGAPNLARVDVARHLQRLAAHAAEVGRLPGRDAAVEVEADPVRCSVETAIPLGLIANELIANSLKHAFHGRDGGRIVVSLRRTGGEGGVRLTVADDGTGPGPAHGDDGGRDGVGRKLVAALARQLGGTLREERDDLGWTVVLDLPPGRCDPLPPAGPAHEAAAPVPLPAAATAAAAAC